MRKLYNPLPEDITIDFDKLGDNPETHTLEGGQVQEFPDHIADLMEDALANKILWRTYPANHNREQRLKEILKEIRA